MKTKYRYILLIFLLWQGIAIGQTTVNKKPKKVIGFDAQVKKKKVEREVKTSTINYRQIAQQLSSTETKDLKHIVNTVDRITLKLVGVYGLQDKLYVKFLIYNDGAVPFYIDGWNYDVQQKKAGKSTSKEIEQPIYEYHRREDQVPANDTLSKVLVFDKFVLDNDESIQIQLRERILTRFPKVNIASKYINAPFPIITPVK